MTNSKKIAFYLRVSTKNQDTKEGSIISQEQRLTDWLMFHNKISDDNLEKQKYDDFAVYKDVESGKSTENRPGYNRMITDIQMKRIHGIACTSISRLNRNLKEFYSLLELSELHQIDVISLKENFDTSTAIGRALLKFMLVFYELEREQTAERGSDNRYERAKRGLWITSTIIGYDNDAQNPGHPTIIPVEAEIVKKIFKLYINSGSISQERKLLKKEGIQTPARKLTGANKGQPKDFADETIRRILQNKAYLGIVQYQKGNMGKTDLPLGKAYEEFDGVWKPIIENDVFEKANQILVSNSSIKGNVIASKKKTYELSGIIACGNCSKSTMRTTSGTSGTGKQYHYYKCVDCSTQISASRLEQAVVNTLNELGGDEKILVFNEETYVWDLVSEFDFRWSYFGSSITQDDKLLLSVGNQFNPYVPYTEIAAIIDLDTGEITMIDSVNFNGLYPAQFCADNGICYKAGGFNVNNGFDLNTVEAYEDSTWIPYEPMPIDCANPLVAEMSDGRYFVTCDNRLDNGANLIFSWNSEPEIDWHETFFNGENYEVQISASDIDEDSIAVRLWFQGGPTEWSELQPSGTTFEFIADHAWGLLMTQVHDQWYNDGIHNSISDFEVIAELALDDIHHPSEFYLSQNYPNPFNPITRIDYYLLKYGLAELNIYNLSGGLVTTLVYERQSGHQSVMWQVEDYPSGHYLYRLLFDGHVVEEKKMVVVK